MDDEITKVSDCMRAILHRGNTQEKERNEKTLGKLFTNLFRQPASAAPENLRGKNAIFNGQGRELPQNILTLYFEPSIRSWGRRWLVEVLRRKQVPQALDVITEDYLQLEPFSLSTDIIRPVTIEMETVAPYLTRIARRFGLDQKNIKDVKILDLRKILRFEYSSGLDVEIDKNWKNWLKNHPKEFRHWDPQILEDKWILLCKTVHMFLNILLAFPAYKRNLKAFTLKILPLWELSERGTCGILYKGRDSNRVEELLEKTHNLGRLALSVDDELCRHQPIEAEPSDSSLIQLCCSVTQRSTDILRDEFYERAGWKETWGGPKWLAENRLCLSGGGIGVYTRLVKLAKEGVSTIFIHSPPGCGKETLWKIPLFADRKKWKARRSLNELEDIPARTRVISCREIPEDKPKKFLLEELAGNPKLAFFDEFNTVKLSAADTFLRLLEEPYQLGKLNFKNTTFVFASNLSPEDLFEAEPDHKINEAVLGRVCRYVVDVPPLKSRPLDIAVSLCNQLYGAIKQYKKNKRELYIDTRGMLLLLNLPWRNNYRDLRVFVNGVKTYLGERNSVRTGEKELTYDEVRTCLKRTGLL